MTSRLEGLAGLFLPLGVTALLAAGLWLGPLAEPLERLELVSYDARFLWRGTRPASPEIAVVHVDDESVRRLEFVRGSPSRTQFAAVIARLLEAGATVVALDYVLDGSAPDDAILEAELAKEDSAVVLAAFIGRDGGWQLPHQRFVQHAAGIGFINFLADPDGRVRRFRYSATYEDADILAFALETARVHLDVRPDEVRETEDHMELHAPAWEDIPARTVRLPVPRGWVDFPGPAGHFKAIGFWEVLAPDFKPERVRGRAVLIGDATTTRAGYDFLMTPFTRHETGRNELGQVSYAEDAVPGIEFHAAALQSILQSRFVRRPARHGVWGWTLVLGLVLGLVCCSRRAPLWLILGLPVVAVAAWVGVAWWAFARHRLWLEVVVPGVGLGLHAVVGLGLFIQRLRAQRRQIGDLFGKYVSGNVVDLLIDKVTGGEAVDRLMQGRRQEVTVLFSDVRGFTSLSESLDPALVATILKRYFGEMIEIVREQHQGTIDKLLGDGLMAFFNAPLPQADHAMRACRTGLAMTAACRRLDLSDLAVDLAEDDPARARLRGKRPLRIGIGICTGNVVVGDLGSSSFVDYTVLGDTVNLTARLEALNKIYASELLVTESTWQQVAGQVVGRRLDEVQVRGRQRPVRIYELLGLAEDADDALRADIEAFEAARGVHEAGDLPAAIAGYQALLARHPEDGPARILCARAEAELAAR